MAYEPCVSCHRKFIGATIFTYVTWWNGNDRHSYRLRQCDACASEIRNTTLESGDARDDQGDWHSAAGELVAAGKPVTLERVSA